MNNRHPSRRDVLKQVTAATALSLGGLPLADAATKVATHPIARENELPGTRDWMLTKTGVDPATKYRCPWIEGYCSRTSVRAGQAIQFFVSTNPAARFTLDIYRLGWYGGDGGRLVERMGPFLGTTQADPPVAEKRLRNCAWNASAELTMPKTSAVMPSVARTAPATSKRPVLGWVSGMNRGASTIIAMPIGTLMKKPARQDTQSARAPPITSPRLAPIPAAAPYQATARGRPGPGGKRAVSSDSDAGATTAAPTPWRARAAMSHQPFDATPTRNDAIAKIARPATNTRRRPKMSPRRAPSRRSPPNTRV